MVLKVCLHEWLSGGVSPCQGEGRGFESRRSLEEAGVAELADAQDLKSCGTNLSYRFDSGLRHSFKTLDKSVIMNE